MLHKLRGATVAPKRESLKGEVEIDEFFLGGHEDGPRPRFTKRSTGTCSSTTRSAP